MSMEEVKQLVEQHPVLVLSKTYCPYCREAKQILGGYEALEGKMEIVELDTIEKGAEMQDAASKVSGQKTVPQIWIGGEFIGGCSDLKAKKESGDLDKLIEELTK